MKRLNDKSLHNLGAFFMGRRKIKRVIKLY